MARLSLSPTLVFQSYGSDALLPQIAWTALRVAIGVFMIHNGFDKLDDIPGFAEAYVQVIGLPFPVFFSYVAAYSEVVGSLLLISGLLTRAGALALFGTMTVAIYHHILVAGFNIPYLELSSIYAAGSAFFLVNGGGRFSLDALLAKALNPAQRLEVAYEASSYKAEATEEVAAE